MMPQSKSLVKTPKTTPGRLPWTTQKRSCAAAPQRPCWRNLPGAALAQVGVNLALRNEFDGPTEDFRRQRLTSAFGFW